MAAQGNSSSSILSDHPSDAKRIADINKWMPEAKTYYKPAVKTIKFSTSGNKSTNTKKTTTVKKAATTTRKK